jgi:hypothetical protein
VLTRDGDVRPDVAGAFTDVDAGVTLSLTADTRFQTTISLVKAALAAICVLALLGMFVALARIEVPAARPLPRRWWRPHAVDVVVTALLGVWWVIGSITVDDGYISGIVRSRGENGFVGNVYRWLNAPEAPFSWFYDLFYLWSQAGGSSTLWMRLPSTLLGVVCWVLLSRFAVPRLGRFAARRSTPWLAALAFATWWIPYNLGLRPEPWVAVGVLGAFLAVERTIATRRVLPLAVGLLVAGVTTALTPGGLIAFMPLLAGLRPLLRVLRARRDLHVWPLLAVLVAAPAAAVLLMVSDQSLAAVLESTRVRTLIGGGQPWFEEYQRYANLLEPGSFQASIGKRAAVLITLLAAAGLLWALRRARAGIATGPAGRLLATFGLGLVALTFTPTKWTQHFGDFAGIGAGVLVLGWWRSRALPCASTPARSSPGSPPSPASARSCWPATTSGPTPRTGSRPRSARCPRNWPAGVSRPMCWRWAGCSSPSSSDGRHGCGPAARRPSGYPGACPPRPHWWRSCWWRCWCCRSAASRGSRSPTATPTRSPPTRWPPSAGSRAGWSPCCRWRPTPRPGCSDRSPVRSRPPNGPSTSAAARCRGSRSRAPPPPAGSSWTPPSAPAPFRWSSRRRASPARATT